MSYYKYLKNVKESKKDLLSKWCVENIQLQKQKEKQYKKHANEILIRDKNKNYKIVSKNYYLYYIQEDEFDTDEEFEDEEWSKEVERIKLKYNKINT